ncbi:MAG: PAS domain-containing hybrid sensor histidine kinase/response regulator [Methanoregulaceae archaeon]|nr:MAG: PAS domain-containing hybrid sensor histidine kinase/response regulator [Methanoregulaceae archaeon]
MRQYPFSEFEEVLRLFMIAAACIGAILTSVFSLTHGITEVFPFLYILPIILVVYFYPKRAVLFALFISLMYISLVFLLASGDTNLMIIATAWFAIFMTIAVVASSYANQLLEERTRIRHIIDNSQDGIFCFSLNSGSLIAVNAKFAKVLRYERTDLIGRDISQIWTDADERAGFIHLVKTERKPLDTEILLRARDASVLRFVISPLQVTRDRVLCSAVDITGSMIADEEIQKTLEDLEEQVRARTAHLERINKELKAEILEHRRFESTIFPKGKDLPDNEVEGEK